MNGLIGLLLVGIAISAAKASTEATVCSACQIIFGLSQELTFQIKLKEALLNHCAQKDHDKLCSLGVNALMKLLEQKMDPGEICSGKGICPSECKLFPEWPIKLPPQPEKWPVERKLVSVFEETEKSALLRLLQNTVPRLSGQEERNLLANTIYSLFQLIGAHTADWRNDGDDCKPWNITCHGEHVAEHLPLHDRDNDRFAPAGDTTLRGSHWRGSDCDDKRNDVYPGRKTSSYQSDVDHNCNGIVGGNASGTYEELFCTGTGQRGLIMLGDSATAHFHIPPQWLTAKGWNLDGLIPNAMDEFDFPMCSWGTGHVTAEECPKQAPVPGVEGVVSLYTQLRDRNLCNSNDFQNIGVNGARISSAAGLVEAMARERTTDSPALVYLSLIGNDVCNGHPNFDHMTSPDVFYQKAMETLQEIDARVPKGSHVVAVGLVAGELLYDTMHAEQHPLGMTYAELYDFMNCLEENPCWGWLNSNATVRQMTTAHKDQLNDVWKNISATQSSSFEHFQFIYYEPNWIKLFADYAAQPGHAATDLIEKGDGFHPSQAGNALFAKHFFSWLEMNHPEAVGPVNPHNAEIAENFFSSSK